MPSSSINVGINQLGKQLVEKIDVHFKNHEPDFYKSYILSASLELKDTDQQLSIIKEGEFAISHSKDIKAWFDSELYGEINRLRNVVTGLVDGEISINIILSICESNSSSQLKLLLDAISELDKAQQVSGISVKLFVILYDVKNIVPIQDSVVQEELKELEKIVTEYDSIISDIYYLDDRNPSRVILKLNLDWLAFAIGEFLVFQMICETSGAIMNKSKIFGLGVIHFNELLFRSVVANTILQYKFKDEGILEEGGVRLRDLYKKCNPFIAGHQNFFGGFLAKHPYSEENNSELTTNSKSYIDDFKSSLDQFITNENNKIGESKALLAHLLGEDDKKIEGIDWTGERFDINDLEHDIIDYFNKYLEEKDQVKFKDQKALRIEITELSQGIKGDEKSLKSIEEQAKEIHRDLDISFEDGIFSVDGKRINASGYIPSPISPSDEIYTYNDEPIPDAVDLSAYFSTVKNQGSIGSCTAFPIAAVYEFFAKQNKKSVDISELFVYYNTRDLKGKSNLDIGATLLDTIHSVKEKGACHSESHPYSIDSFVNKPTEEAYNEARHQVVNNAARININEKDFKQAIANGHPVIIGLKIFESFYPKNESGIVPFPSDNESRDTNHGSHALLVVGYNDDEKLFKIRNSWGEEFGDKGYCYVPYDYIANSEFCMEAFVITDIVDLSFNGFTYDSNTSFSFLKHRAIRLKTIREYNLRAKKRRSAEVKKNYDDLALQNEVNAERIKDPLFRKKLFNRLKEEAAQRLRESNPTSIEIETNNNMPFLFIGLGIITIIISILFFSRISIYGTTAGIIIGLILLVLGVLRLSKKNKFSEIGTIKQGPDFGDKDKYAFEAADNLFDIFEEMSQGLIKRYKAISNYYTKVKNWQEKSEATLNRIEYDSPDFVINVIKKEPLLKYLDKEKLSFLKNLPNLSNTFHKSYNPKTDNVNEVFKELEDNYLDDIYKNIENILDISIVDYIQGEKEYPYFEPAPSLAKTISNLQKVSMPFCNIKQTTNALQIQDYVVHERIANNEEGKLNEFKTHRGAAINPILSFRSNNSKKYVAIQVAALNSIKDLVRYDL